MKFLKKTPKRYVSSDEFVTVRLRSFGGAA